MRDATEKLYEEVLIVRCQTGDDRAFRELVDRYTPRLRYLLRKMVVDHHVADDLLQEVWFKVFQAIGTLRDVGAFPQWVYTIARVRAYQELRRPSQPPVPLVAEALSQRPPGKEMDLAERIHEALDRIPTEQREILVLRYLEAMSYDEIAAVIGCPLGTVRSRIHHAKLALRECLKRETH